MTHVGMRVYWTAIGMFFSSLLASASREKIRRKDSAELKP
jgi:hypothetical protein